MDYFTGSNLSVVKYGLNRGEKNEYILVSSITVLITEKNIIAVSHLQGIYRGHAEFLGKQIYQNSTSNTRLCH